MGLSPTQIRAPINSNIYSHSKTAQKHSKGGFLRWTPLQQRPFHLVNHAAPHCLRLSSCRCSCAFSAEQVVGPLSSLLPLLVGTLGLSRAERTEAHILTRYIAGTAAPCAPHSSFSLRCRHISLSFGKYPVAAMSNHQFQGLVPVVTGFPRLEGWATNFSQLVVLKTVLTTAGHVD